MTNRWLGGVCPFRPNAEDGMICGKAARAEAIVARLKNSRRDKFEAGVRFKIRFSISCKSAQVRQQWTFAIYVSANGQIGWLKIGRSFAVIVNKVARKNRT
jgi:hypothetical protein